MMFGVRHARHTQGAFAFAAVGLALIFSSPSSAAEYGMAVVPKQIIYPGQEIDVSQMTLVPVTNPDIAPGYAQSLDDVSGMITTRTLLPGRTIMVNGLRQAWTVKRGDRVLLVYDNGFLKITAAGTPLNDGLVGDLVKARNTDTGVIVSGTVKGDGSILVVQK